MKINNLIIVIIGFIVIFSCNKKESEEISDLDKIKHNNKNSYPSTKMDSAQAIHNITQQKFFSTKDKYIKYRKSKTINKSLNHKNTPL